MCVKFCEIIVNIVGAAFNKERRIVQEMARYIKTASKNRCYVRTVTEFKNIYCLLFLLFVHSTSMEFAVIQLQPHSSCEFSDTRNSLREHCKCSANTALLLV